MRIDFCYNNHNVLWWYLLPAQYDYSVHCAVYSIKHPSRFWGLCNFQTLWFPPDFDKNTKFVWICTSPWMKLKSHCVNCHKSWRFFTVKYFWCSFGSPLRVPAENTSKNAKVRYVVRYLPLSRGWPRRKVFGGRFRNKFGTHFNCGCGSRLIYVIMDYMSADWFFLACLQLLCAYFYAPNV